MSPETNELERQQASSLVQEGRGNGGGDKNSGDDDVRHVTQKIMRQIEGGRER